MVQSSGIKDKLRSSVLKELARERGSKRTREEARKDDTDDDSNEDEEQAKLKLERLMSQARCSNTSLPSILPRPKNSNAFGPTVKLDKLLKMPVRADEVSSSNNTQRPDDEDPAQRLNEDGMVEVDVSKVVGDVSQTLIKELTVERTKPDAVIVPKGKEKQKNQITYLAKLGKANELERKEQAAQGRLNKAAARSKYGW